MIVGSAHSATRHVERTRAMASYDTFGKFYDAVMGDRAKEAERLRSFIRKANPKAKKILELACGTGSLLKHWSRHYRVYGLDLSKQMLSIARKKVPQANLSRQNMVTFHLPERFDVICCVYDSINHVSSFSQWKAIFRNIHQHLSTGGAFVFDINTQKKLNRHIAEPAWVHRFGDNFLIMKVTGTEKNRTSNWNIKVFERIRRNRYLLHEEDIQEVSFPTRKIVRALRVHFPSVEIMDPDRKHPSMESDRLYFICKT
ncbi:MAG TPA: class I SAM-dependent methyltransferase [Terriglobia bacterium]|nr:class I SAM-dependent methyltransferase [Terriglobia bacterium]